MTCNIHHISPGHCLVNQAMSHQVSLDLSLFVPYYTGYYSLRHPLYMSVSTNLLRPSDIGQLTLADEISFNLVAHTINQQKYSIKPLERPYMTLQYTCNSIALVHHKNLYHNQIINMASENTPEGVTSVICGYMYPCLFMRIKISPFSRNLGEIIIYPFLRNFDKNI